MGVELMVVPRWFMSKLFRNSSSGALTRAQAVALEKKRSAEQRQHMRQARELAAQGRGYDTEVAHVARGEMVVPVQLQNPNVLAALSRAAAAYGVPLEMLKIGNALNRINPNTGAPEFGIMDWFSGAKKSAPSDDVTIIQGPYPPGDPRYECDPECDPEWADELEAARQHFREFPTQSNPIIGGIARVREPFEKCIRERWPEQPAPKIGVGGIRG